MRNPAVQSLLLTAILALAPLGATLADQDAEAERPLLVKIHADWCGTCTKLDSTWQDLQTRYGDAVQFVVLDVTDRSDVQVALLEADRLGIRSVFDHYKSRTGTIVVIDPRTREPVEALKGQTDVERYAEPIERARAS